MAGVTIAGTDLLRRLADGGVLVVMAAEAAEPIFVTDVFRILAPVGLHEGEEIIFVDLGRRGDGLCGGRLIAVLLAYASRDCGSGFCFCGIGFG